LKPWIIEIAEPLPDIDNNFRYLRCGMLADALIGRGHEVRWWSSTFNHMLKKNRFNKTTTIEPRPAFQITLLHGPGYKKNISIGRIKHNRITARSFEFQAHQCQSKPDVILVCLPTLEMAEKAVAYGRAHCIPVVVDVRDPWPDLYLSAFPHFLRGIARLGLVSEFRRAQRILRGASGITAVSETYLRWALTYAGRPRQESDGVFPLGCVGPDIEAKRDIESRAVALRDKYGLRRGIPVATFIGMFGASYDLATVVAAAKELQKVGSPNYQIVLAGNGDNNSNLRKKAQGLPNVTFTGWIDQTSMFQLMSISSIGLATYSEGALQSLPNKPFEYMAAGLPLLSSLRGEMETIIQKYNIGLQYQPGKVSSLVKQLCWFAANEEERRKMGFRARRLFEEKYSDKVVYPKFISHLENIANKING